MFLDLSFEKILRILAVAFGLTIAVLFSFMMEQKIAAVKDMMTAWAAREKADLSYWFRFKLPDQGRLIIFGESEAPAALAATGTAASVPVLVYHGEGEGARSMPMTIFVDHMRALQSNGWRSITLPEFESFMKGTGTVPDKSFLLTFDDGRTDTFYASDPVLKDLGYTGVMFVITGFSLPENGAMPTDAFYLSKSELAHMAASGRWELESHGDQDHRAYVVPTVLPDGSLDLVSKAHFLSNKFWIPNLARMETASEFTARVTNDLTTAKQILESDFGSPISAFAYPFNDFGQDSLNFPQAQAVLDALIPTLYRYTFYQTWPGNGDTFNYPNPQVHFIKRIEPPVSWNGDDLIQALDRGRKKELPFETTSFGSGWSTNWGILGTSGGLSLSAASTTGASAFLDGTESWADYTLKASADLRHGTLSLITRHTETSAPYPDCAFSENRIYLERHASTSVVTLASAPYDPPAQPARVSVSMSIRGNSAACSAYGTRVSATIPGISPRGGIGVTVWSPNEGDANATFTRLSADPL